MAGETIVECPKCNCIFAYTDADVLEDNSNPDFISYYIVCPNETCSERMHVVPNPENNPEV